MKFRRHRGGLSSSIATTVEMTPTKIALAGYLNVSPSELNVKPYVHDYRIDWETHIVTIKGVPAGFTDGPICE